MFSVGGKVLDFYDDLGLKLLSGSSYLEKVASLPVGDPEKLTTLDDRQFGVIFLTKKGEAIRKYPLNDLTNTALSNVYFDLTHEKLPPEAKVAAATMIKKACELFGVACAPAVSKYAADDLDDGRNYVHLDKVAQAAGRPIDLFRQLHDSYAENRDSYSRDDRIELAKAMQAAGEKFGFDVHEDLKPFAIKDPIVDREALFSQCALRKQLKAGDYQATHLLDEFLEKHAQFEPDEAVKLLETFDRQFGLDRHWGGGLEPYGILMEKVSYHAIPLSGRRSFAYTDQELKSWVASNGDLVVKMFGKDLGAKIKADPTSVWSLPAASRDFIAARIEHARESSPIEAE
jgi:hypothetical protein